MKNKVFLSYSGDMFLIPVEQFEQETKAYCEAIKNGDEETMLKFEEGETGWTYAP
nr:hypothetical protein [Vibrio splendidus]MCC4882916.1 hypothetical protein [Vibrio splendidus]